MLNISLARSMFKCSSAGAQALGTPNPTIRSHSGFKSDQTGGHKVLYFKPGQFYQAIHNGPLTPGNIFNFKTGPSRLYSCPKALLANRARRMFSRRGGAHMVRSTVDQQLNRSSLHVDVVEHQLVVGPLHQFDIVLQAP